MPQQRYTAPYDRLAMLETEYRIPEKTSLKASGIVCSGLYMSNSNARPVCGMSQFQCYVCGMAFSNQILLRNHETGSHKFFRCLHRGCSQVFPHAATLTHHENVFHKALCCDGCGTEVRGTSLIPKHLSFLHGLTSPFVCVCAGCNIFFLSPAAHAEHINKSHGAKMGLARLPIRISPTTESGNNSQVMIPAPCVDDETIESFFGSLLNQIVPDADNTSPMIETPASTYRNVYQFDPVD